MTKNEVEILLVEDNPDDLELMLRVLQKELYMVNNIQIVRDGEEALNYIFRRGPFASRDPNGVPKLILLDLKLPKVDGLEVLRQVKANPSTRSIPIVILTTSKEEKDMVTSYQLGVNSYLQKPVDFSEFVKIVKEVGFYWLMVNQPAPPKMIPTGAA